jgi:hypothetical protein
MNVIFVDGRDLTLPDDHMVEHISVVDLFDSFRIVYDKYIIDQVAIWGISVVSSFREAAMVGSSMGSPPW